MSKAGDSDSRRRHVQTTHRALSELARHCCAQCQQRAYKLLSVRRSNASTDPPPPRPRPQITRLPPSLTRLPALRRDLPCTTRNRPFYRKHARPTHSFPSLLRVPTVHASGAVHLHSGPPSFSAYAVRQAPCTSTRFARTLHGDCGLTAPFCIMYVFTPHHVMYLAHFSLL